ncbi:Protein NDRG3 [Plecturocebus cupreus]
MAVHASSQLLRRLRQENCLNPGGGDCSEPRLCQEWQNIKKTYKEIRVLSNEEELQANLDLIQTYRMHIAQDINQDNLQLFLNSYNGRRDLEIERPILGQNDNKLKTLKCSTLLVVGDSSPAVEAVVECNSRLNPINTTLLKMADCGGLPQVVQPGKLTEAFKYFLQGMGYIPSASMTRLARSRTHSTSSSIGSGESPFSRSVTSNQSDGTQESCESPDVLDRHQTMEVSC